MLSPFLRRGVTSARPSPWTCRTCLQSQRQGLLLLRHRNHFATRAGEATRAGKSGKSWRRLGTVLAVLGGGVAVGAGAVALNDDAKHAWAAAQRTYRVAATLALNIKE